MDVAVEKGKPMTTPDGLVTVMSPDGKVMVYAANGRIMSATEGSPQTAKGPNGFSGMAIGAPPSVTVNEPPHIASGSKGYSGVNSATANPMAHTQALEQRLQMLDAQLQSLAQELHNLHKEIAESRGQLERPATSEMRGR